MQTFMHACMNRKFEESNAMFDNDLDTKVFYHKVFI
jgi:hypothetical protein